MTGLEYSSQCRDEVVWAQAWLHLATGDKLLLDRAEEGYRDAGLANSTEFSWDDKVSGSGWFQTSSTGTWNYGPSSQSH